MRCSFYVFLCSSLLLAGAWLSPATGSSFTFTTIDPPASSEASAVGINDVGQIVGQYGFVLPKGDIGFLLSGGSYTPIDPPSSTGASSATGINNGGQIVGFFSDSSANHGFLLSGGSYITLDVPGSASTVAHEINDADQIVGTYFGGGGLHGFLLAGDTYATLDVPGAVTTEARGINDAGQIVGFFSDAGGKSHGFLLSAGTYTILDVPGATDTEAAGINDVGQIVGFYFKGGPHGFLLNGSGYTTLDVPGATETFPSKINDAGEIVGAYFIAHGSDHAFLATPQAVVPGPATGLLFATGLVVLLGYGWRRRQRTASRREEPFVFATLSTLDREGPRPDNPAVRAGAGGRGDRVIDRRTFLAGTGAVLLTAPRAAEAEQTGKVFRIGILANVAITDPQGAPLWGAFIQGLRELGYIEGKNIIIKLRSSEGKYERLPELAAELVRLKVDVIVVPAPQNASAAKAATRTIPIVMAGGVDPVAEGLVTSLAHPGGNITGMTGVGPEIGGKRLELLKEAVPKMSRMAFLSNPVNPISHLYLGETTAAARSLRVQLQMLDAREPDELEKAFAAMTHGRADAALVVNDGMFLLQRTRIAALAASQRLPTMFAGREYVDAGGLMSYSPSARDSFRRAAIYVDKILKGAKPSDLPIERSTKFELVINLKTAKALGLTIPPSLLGRADEVIQ
jgi:putative ABC transport system substrate-binding protein